MTAARQLSSAPKAPRVELFRLFSEPGRLQVLALCAEEQLSVTELAQLLNDSQPQISRKVSALRELNVLQVRREGTRIFAHADSQLVAADPLVAEAVAEGRRLCLADGSLARIPGIVAAREALGQTHFETVAPAASTVPSSPEHLAHLAALAPLLPSHQLAIDVGTGDGLVLDILAPLYQRVIAVDRSRAQLARVAERVAARGFHHVSLFPGSYDDAALLQRVDAAGGADLVFAGRTLHHASKPANAIASMARLLRKGGSLVILDDLTHETDVMRAEAGDVWLGFEAADVSQWVRDAGLHFQGEVTIPTAFHPDGLDAKLNWHAWVARSAS